MTKASPQIAARYRGGMRLPEFNALDAAGAAAVVGVWAAIPPWVDEIVAGRPFASVDELTDAAAAACAQWTPADLDAALAHHPRIGERTAATGAAAEASRREQGPMRGADAETAARLATGNAGYERRFGRVFLIRAAGRSPAEMLGELERRLTNDADTEASEALEQLAQIALLRLRAAVSDDERVPS